MAEAARPIDRLVAGYAALSALALLAPGRPAVWPLLVIAHLALVLLALRPGPLRLTLRRAGARTPRLTRFLADWYPLLLMPLLYAELETLNVALHGGRFFDPLIMRSEEALFGGQPSLTLAYRAHSLALSEALHAGYLSYYPLIYLPPIALYVRGRRDAFGAVVFTLMLTFFAHYLVFIGFPVQGPRYLFPPPDGDLSAGPLYQLTHWILESGSTRGAAFPSSHVAVGVAQTLGVWRYLRRGLPLALLSTIGLSVGAVYGGFHYAIDVLAGAVAGLALALAAPRLRERLRR